MTRPCGWVALLTLLAGTPAPAGDATPAKPVAFRDDFTADPRPTYEVKGEVQWVKGAVTLGPGARLVRALLLGYFAEVEVTLRRPRGAKASMLQIALSEGQRSAEAALLLTDGKVILGNLADRPAHVLGLGEAGDGPWRLCARLEYGLLRLKAWRAAQPEPAGWHSCRHAGTSLWQPDRVTISGGKGDGVAVEHLAVRGRPRLELSAERSQQQRRAERLSLTAALHFRAGKYADAEAAAREAVGLGRKVLPPDHPGLAQALSALGVALMQQGLLEDGRLLLDEALAIDRKALPPDHPDLASSLNNLGGLLSQQGRLVEARRLHEEALTIRRGVLPKDHLLLVYSLNNLGQALQAQGQLDAARRHYEQALALLAKAPPESALELAGILANLGVLAQAQGRADEARRHHEQALTVVRKVLPPDHPDLAIRILNLGGALEALGRPDEARRHYQEVLALCKKAAAPDPVLLAIALNNLGMTFEDEGKGDEARRYYEEALAGGGRALPPDNPRGAILRANLGGALCGLGRRDEGWPHLLAATAGRVRQLAVAAAGSAQADHAALLRQGRPHLDQLVGAAAESPDLAPARLRELWHGLLDGKAISGSLLAHRQRRLLEGGDEKARADFERLLGLRRRLANLLLHGGELARREADRLGGEADELERDLARRVQALGDWHKALRADAAEVAGRLGPGAVLVELVRYHPYRFRRAAGESPWQEAQYAAVLLWRGAGAGPQLRLVPLGAAWPLENAIRSWRRQVQAGRVDGAAEKELRGRLWAPLAKALPEKTTRLMIAPEGELALVPFEAIRLEDDKYLVERYAVSYVTSGRDLMPSPRPKERSNVAILLADPDYDRLEGDGGKAAPSEGERGQGELRAGLRFRPLPGFAREAEAVGRLLGRLSQWRTQPARGAGASEEALAKVSRPRLLYCITHGFFLGDIQRAPGAGWRRELELVGAVRLPSVGADPRLRSGLALAGANKWQERSAKGLSDGLLTALEVENLDLWGTELVVLSACDTGRGQIQIGEGVLGLRRAFQLAGAQTVLASLWKVPDAETEQLMSDALSRWLKGAPPHEALRAAQREMIRRLRAGPERERREAPPLYWAGFVCHGR